MTDKRKEAENAKLLEEHDTHQRDLDLQQVLSTEHGRRFYYRLVMLEARLESPSFTRGDPHVTSYLEGTRAVGQRLLEEAQRVCPELWVRMLAERLAAQASAAGPRAGATPAELELDP